MNKDNYEALRKKHNLPEFEKLDTEFNISEIEEDGRPLRQIRGKMEEKIEFFVEILNIILQPDANSFSDLYECRFFNDEEKAKALELFKELMIVDRGLIEAEVLSEEKADAESIREAYAVVCKIKSDILPLVRKMKDIWKRPTAKKEILGYLG